MKVPLEISFRNMHPSAYVEAYIREKANHLDYFSVRITRCRVVVTTCRVGMNSGRFHRRMKNLYHAQVDIVLPFMVIAVAEDSPNPVHDDVYLALRDAFDATGRQFEKTLRASAGNACRASPPSPAAHFERF